MLANAEALLVEVRQARIALAAAAESAERTTYLSMVETFERGLLAALEDVVGELKTLRSDPAGRRGYEGGWRGYEGCAAAAAGRSGGGSGQVEKLAKAAMGSMFQGGEGEHVTAESIQAKRAAKKAFRSRLEERWSREEDPEGCGRS